MLTLCHFAVFFISALIIITFYSDFGVPLTIPFLFFVNHMMDPRTRTLVLGDSYVRRLHTSMSETPDAYSNRVFLDTALDERLDFHGTGGRTTKGICDYDQEWGRWYSPHVIFLMVGGNDLIDPNLSALDVASRIHNLAKSLVETEGCYFVFVASITDRTSYPYLDPSYPQIVGDCNKYLKALFEAEVNFFTGPYVACTVNLLRLCLTMGSI